MRERSWWKKAKENQKERERETGRWEKVAAWRPVRRGKNDRALTRYKSHYGVNLLDPSPPTDFQPPGTALGCRLWATSHANSDKVSLSPSCFFSRSVLLLLLSSFLCLFYYLQRTADVSILVTFRLASLCHSLSISSSLSLWFCSAGYPHSRHPRGTPTPTDQSQGISVPGTSAC